MRRFLAVLALALVVWGFLLAIGVIDDGFGCGTERWQVKTLTDPDAGNVAYRHVQDTTIATLVNLPAPSSLPTTRLPAERSVLRIHVRLIVYKLEEDGDIHLVVGDPANPGTTMIVEFPWVPCTQGAQHRYAMKRARAAFVRHIGEPTGRWKTASGTARVTGVLFFDTKHGQRGAAPNAIELHPALSFRLEKR